MAHVELYTKEFCGYCARAKSLLRSKGVEFEEYDITMGGPKREEMLSAAMVAPLFRRSLSTANILAAATT